MEDSTKFLILYILIFILFLIVIYMMFGPIPSQDNFIKGNISLSKTSGKNYYILAYNPSNGDITALETDSTVAAVPTVPLTF
jgi:hypothetical protein